jgi:hypothetical protein
MNLLSFVIKYLPEKSTLSGIRDTLISQTLHTIRIGLDLTYQAMFYFLSSQEDSLTLPVEKENSLVYLKKCTGQYYIIGIKKGQSNTLKHELMHALYYTNPKYRQSVERILDSGPSLLPISIYIKNLGYHNEVLRDETHAYLVTCQDNLKKAAINFDIYKPIIKLLNTNYKKYSKS